MSRVRIDVSRYDFCFWKSLGAHRTGRGLLEGGQEFSLRGSRECRGLRFCENRFMTLFEHIRMALIADDVDSSGAACACRVL